MYYEQLHLFPTIACITNSRKSSSSAKLPGTAGGEVKEEGRKKAKQEAKQEGARGEQGKEGRIAPLSQPEVESGEKRDGNALQPAGRKVFCACCV